MLIGFEIECEVQRSTDLEAMFYSLQSDYHSDGSVSSYHDGYSSIEFVTKPLAYDSADYRLFYSQLEKYLQEEVIILNRTCGSHFHFSYPTYEWGAIDAKVINDYLDLVRVKFPALWRARKDNGYCHPDKLEVAQCADGTRYRAVNLTASQEHGTIEVRFYGYYDGFSVAEYKKYVEFTIKYFNRVVRNTDKRRHIAQIVENVANKGDKICVN